MRWLKTVWCWCCWLVKEIGKPVELEDGSLVVTGGMGPEFGCTTMFNPIIIPPRLKKEAPAEPTPHA